jgi:tetratricopeptide (TPR) repeat protein
MPKPISMCRIVMLASFALLFGGNLSSQPAPAGQVASAAQRMSEKEMDDFVARIRQEYAEKANLVADLYVKSQQAYYSNDYQLALQHIDKAIVQVENADLHAFKGVILFGMGNLTLARSQFEKALALDDKVPIPGLEGLREWLKEQRLIQ